jgi:hypothetical protein
MEEAAEAAAAAVMAVDGVGRAWHTPLSRRGDGQAGIAQGSQPVRWFRVPAGGGGFGMGMGGRERSRGGEEAGERREEKQPGDGSLCAQRIWPRGASTMTRHFDSGISKAGPAGSTPQQGIWFGWAFRLDTSQSQLSLDQ